MLGNGRLEAFCFDGKKRLCHIRGKMRKKVWVNVVSIIRYLNCFASAIEPSDRGWKNFNNL